MLKFCCNLPNCNRRFATDRGLYQHKVKDPIHNRKKSYDSYNKVGKKRHFQITYEGSRHAESNLNKKPSTGPRYSINTDIMSDIVEEDKNSYEDLEEIAAENFDEFSRRNVNDLFLSVGNEDDGDNVAVDDKIDGEDDGNKFDEDDEKIEFL